MICEMKNSFQLIKILDKDFILLILNMAVLIKNFQL